MNLQNFVPEYSRLLGNPAMFLIVSGLLLGLILPLKVGKKTIFIADLFLVPLLSIGILFTAIQAFIDFHCSLYGLQAACITNDSIIQSFPTLFLTIGYTIFTNILLVIANILLGTLLSIPFKWVLTKYTGLYGSKDADEALQYNENQNPDYFQLYEANKNKSPIKNHQQNTSNQKPTFGQKPGVKTPVKPSFPSIMQKGSNPYAKKP